MKKENRTARLIAFKNENYNWLIKQKEDSGLSCTLLLNTLIDHARLKNLDWSDLVCEIHDYIKDEN